MATKLGDIVILENVAAISGAIHGDKRFQQFYNAMPEGSGSVYALVIALAMELTEWEAANTPDNGETAYDALDLGWYEVVDAIADGAIKAAIEFPHVDARAIVRDAVRK